MTNSLDPIDHSKLDESLKEPLLSGQVDVDEPPSEITFLKAANVTSPDVTLEYLEKQRAISEEWDMKKFNFFSSDEDQTVTGDYQPPTFRGTKTEEPQQVEKESTGKTETVPEKRASRSSTVRKESNPVGKSGQVKEVSVTKLSDARKTAETVSRGSQLRSMSIDGRPRVFSRDGTTASEKTIQREITATLPGIEKASKTAPKGSVLSSIGKFLFEGLKGIGYVVSLPFRLVALIVGAVLVAASLLATLVTGLAFLVVGEFIGLFGILIEQKNILLYANALAFMISYFPSAVFGIGLIEIGLGENPLKDERELFDKVTDMLLPSAPR